MGLKEKMRLVRNVFLTHREMGQSEALYRIIHSMHLTESSIGDVFLNTGRKKSRFLKKISEDEANEAANVVTIAESDGLYVETSSLLDKYEKRPFNLKWMSPMQFSKRYTTARATKSDLKRELESDDDNQESSGEDESVSDVTQLPLDIDNTIENDFIIHRDRSKRKPLPKRITLQGQFYPGEPRYMQLRRPLVVRYHKFRKTTESHDYLFSELELYHVFQSKEERLRCIEDIEFCLETYQNSLDQINYVRSKTMPFVTHVEDGLEKAEVIYNEENAAETLDPQAAQDNAECEVEGVNDQETFVAFDYDKLEDTYAEKSDALFKRIQIDGIDELNEKTQNLDDDQYFVLEKIINYAKQFKRAVLQKVPLPQPLRLKILGSAGSGKSHLIDLICQWVERILRQEGDDLDQPYIVKTAYTGTASCNIGGKYHLILMTILISINKNNVGQTIHNTFKFQFGSASQGLGDKQRDLMRTVLRNLRFGKF